MRAVKELMPLPQVSRSGLLAACSFSLHSLASLLPARTAERRQFSPRWPDPQTFTHVDLPTGKRLYLPLKPGQVGPQPVDFPAIALRFP